jgi:hypothetical protein
MRYLLAILMEPSTPLGVGQIVVGAILILAGQAEVGGTLVTTGLAGILLKERGGQRGATPQSDIAELVAAEVAKALASSNTQQQRDQG